jgi:hypothetical protein
VFLAIGASWMVSIGADTNPARDCASRDSADVADCVHDTTNAKRIWLIGGVAEFALVAAYVPMSRRNPLVAYRVVQWTLVAHWVGNTWVCLSLIYIPSSC